VCNLDHVVISAILFASRSIGEKHLLLYRFVRASVVFAGISYTTLKFYSCSSSAINCKNGTILQWKISQLLHCAYNS
jgi:hypothetical protein